MTRTRALDAAIRSPSLHWGGHRDPSAELLPRVTQLLDAQLGWEWDSSCQLLIPASLQTPPQPPPLHTYQTNASLTTFCLDLTPCPGGPRTEGLRDTSLPLRILEPTLGTFKVVCQLFRQGLGPHLTPGQWVTSYLKTLKVGTFLVVQWLRVHQPMQGTWVQILGPGGSHIPQGNWACPPPLLWIMCTEPVLCNKRDHHNKKPEYRNSRVALTSHN